MGCVPSWRDIACAGKAMLCEISPVSAKINARPSYVQIPSEQKTESPSVRQQSVVAVQV
jgi:hypothetical protein